MRFDFSTLPLKNRAFSQKPTVFMDQEAKTFLSAIIDVAAIETGNRVAREFWQRKQLENLLTSAVQRSAFWRNRIGRTKISGLDITDLPVQTRGDVIAQVVKEGSLGGVAGQPNTTIKHSTSGSSGTPVVFFVTEKNTVYNLVRPLGQYLFDEVDLSLNCTRIAGDRGAAGAPGFRAKKSDSWAGPLESVLRTGSFKYVEIFHPKMDALCEELARDELGYFIAQPRAFELIFRHAGPEFFRKTGTVVVTPIAEAMDPEMRAAFDSLGIAVRGNYSSEEVGPIAFECAQTPGSFHVATSNVIVEVVYEGLPKVNGKRCGRVLVTGLHSYATPFIRYDIGDIATLDERCACGHDGPALSNIYGRDKSLLKHADGRVSIFFPRGKELMAIAKFDEYRIRQVAFDKLVLEIGGRDSLTEREVRGFEELLKDHAGPGFSIEIRPVAAIDWGASPKRLGFLSEV